MTSWIWYVWHAPGGLEAVGTRDGPSEPGLGRLGRLDRLGRLGRLDRLDRRRYSPARTSSATRSPERTAPSMYPLNTSLVSVPAQWIRPTGVRRALP
jgi:hypothetical protein